MSKVSCPACATEHAPSALVCPNCQRLVHGDRLKATAVRAEAARARGDAKEEFQAWTEAASLLPLGSKQRQTIDKRIAEIEAPAVSGLQAESAPRPKWASLGGPIGVALLVLWKAKGVLLLVLGKLKFLTLGFSKLGTVVSFLASFAVYWGLWGWRYALGFLIAMYIHEMGHVAALIRFGIPASPPMFVPGLGAFVRMNAHPTTTGQDARIGLAGPEWGLGAALVAYIGYFATGDQIWAAIGHSAAFLNLFNLLPVWQLDGGRGFAALTRWQRLAVAVTFGGAWAITREGLLGLLCVVAVYRVFADRTELGDAGVLGRFAFLITAFSAILVLGRPAA